MFEIDKITESLGWCTIINILFLVLSSLVLLLFKDRVFTFHSRLFGLNKAELNGLYFKWLGNYKIVTVTLFLVPYLALKIMS